MLSTHANDNVVLEVSGEDSMLPVASGYDNQVGNLIRQLSLRETESLKKESRALPTRQELYEYD